MKAHLSSLAKFSAVCTLAICSVALAQAPAGAPSNSTGQCKDGTYSSQAKKSGACRGHQGVKVWFVADASTPAKTTATGNSTPAATPAKPAPGTPAKPASAAVTAPTAAAAPASRPLPATRPNPSTMTAAPGGGPGLVWVNTGTNVYHCPTDNEYGKTKAGKYAREADAKAAGARPARGKACS